MRETKTCAVLGHHPMRFAWGFDEESNGYQMLKLELAQQIAALRQQGVARFAVVADYGVGLYALNSYLGHLESRGRPSR